MEAPWVYFLTMSKEKVVMESEMGAAWGGRERCDNGILGIYEYNWSTGLWDTTSVDMEAQFIPPDISDSDAMKRIPLITVWQLNSSYQPTGCKYVETVDEGVIVVREPAEICWTWDYSVFPPVCREWGPGWRCVKMDSHNYMYPDRRAMSDYDCDCNPP